MNGDPAESIRRIKQKRAVIRTIEPLIERGFDSWLFCARISATPEP